MLSWLKLLKKEPARLATELPKLSDLDNIAGKRVLLRAGLNVPIKNGQITEQFRIEAALPTINFLKEKGAKVIIIAHIGRGSEETLEPVAQVLGEMAGVKWGGELPMGGRAALPELGEGEAVLFENLRRDPREVSGEDVFAKELASLADIYVNDAFADSHREHVSITGVPKYLPSYFGESFIKEYDALSKVLTPEHPAIFIIGGAKFETKLPLVERFSATYDKVVVSGALANDAYKAKGYEVGRSMLSDGALNLSSIISKQNVILPQMVVVEKHSIPEEKKIEDVEIDEKIVDIGISALEAMRPIFESAATILWNGPLGNYEDGFSTGTETLARLIAESSAYSVIGGGDTIASIRALGLSDKFGFLSTAGGAMLVFLETGTLPAIEAVLKRG